MSKRSVSDYASMLLSLFPPGQAWKRDSDGLFRALQSSPAEELARLDGDAWRLLDEVNPATCTDALSDWERVLGLPDECTPLAETFAERRAAVLLKLVRPVGQNAAYYEMLARRLGYQNPKVEEFSPLRAGSRAGHRINQCPGGLYAQQVDGELILTQSLYHGWLFVWRLNVSQGSVVFFRASQSQAGDRLAFWGDSLLECIIRRVKPAHTHVIFGYKGE